MIHFDLICDNDHEFDSWFSNNTAFNDQLEAGLVTCPFCQSDQIEKQLMSPAVPTKSNSKSPDAGPQQSMLAAKNDPLMKELTDNIRKMRQHVAENAEYVGKDFARQAREIHYEEKPARGIYGQASPEDAKSLLEEGVDVMPLPSLPEDNN